MFVKIVTSHHTLSAWVSILFELKKYISFEYNQHHVCIERYTRDCNKTNLRNWFYYLLLWGGAEEGSRRTKTHANFPYIHTRIQNSREFKQHEELNIKPKYLNNVYSNFTAPRPFGPLPRACIHILRQQTHIVPHIHENPTYIPTHIN